MPNLDALKKYLIKCYYIGESKYHGSQVQPNHDTIESEIIQALNTKEYIENLNLANLEFAGRTDRFVSARGACFSFLSKKQPILMEINSVLPKEIGVWAYSIVPSDFSARYNAIQRHYKYILPRLSFNSEWDIDLITKACEELKGTHDFINFSKRDKEKIKTIRTLDEVSFFIENNYFIFDFKSQGFLRQQIRRIIRKIIELGQGLTSYEEFLELFNPVKQVSYQPAAPEGLILWDVKYNNEVEFHIDPKSKERMDKYLLSQKLKAGLKHQLFSLMQHNNLG